MRERRLAHRESKCKGKVLNKVRMADIAEGKINIDAALRTLSG